MSRLRKDFKFPRSFRPRRLQADQSAPSPLPSPAPRPSSTCLRAARYGRSPDNPMRQSAGYRIERERRTSSTSSVSCIVRTTSYTPLPRSFSRPARVVQSNRSVWTWMERRAGSRSRTFVEGRNWSSGSRRSTSYDHHRQTFVNERTE